MSHFTELRMVTTTQIKPRSWNFGTAKEPLLLDAFLDQKAQHYRFFQGYQPWVVQNEKVTWENFFTFCTEEMDDLSKQAVAMVIEYCLSIVDEIAQKLKRPVTVAKLKVEFAERYSEVYDNLAYQYLFAMRHPIVREAVNNAVRNRFTET
ncbi:MAG: hypothetical protein JO076_08645 [Verrucomicrobia bacterium]|nr:hypothetical protein [Verrucomicrobiota bacterium]